MADAPRYGVKKKAVLANPNPLFVQWLREWREDAAEKNLKTQYTYGKALKSLLKFPLRLQSGKDCKILEYFGDKICKMLDDRLARHVAQYGTIDPVPPDGDDDTTATISYSLTAQPRKKKEKSVGAAQSTRTSTSASLPAHSHAPVGVPVPVVSGPTAARGSRVHEISDSENTDNETIPAQPPKKRQKSGRRSGEYVPVYRSGPYAILVTLYKDTLSAESHGYLTKAELIMKAQGLADSSFSQPEPGNRYTAWSSMGTLIKRGLVTKERSPARFNLTEAGSQLAHRLLSAQGDQDANTSTTTTSTSYRASIEPTVPIPVLPSLNMDMDYQSPKATFSSDAHRTKSDEHRTKSATDTHKAKSANNSGPKAKFAARLPSFVPDRGVDTGGSGRCAQDDMPMLDMDTDLDFGNDRFSDDELSGMQNGPDVSTSASASTRLEYWYITDEGEETVLKDKAVVTIDDELGVGFLIKCYNSDLVASGLRYTIDTSRFATGDYVYAFLGNADTFDVAKPPAIKGPTTKPTESAISHNGTGSKDATVNGTKQKKNAEKPPRKAGNSKKIKQHTTPQLLPLIQNNDNNQSTSSLINNQSNSCQINNQSNSGQINNQSNSSHLNEHVLTISSEESSLDSVSSVPQKNKPGIQNTNTNTKPASNKYTFKNIHKESVSHASSNSHAFKNKENGDRNAFPSCSAVKNKENSCSIPSSNSLTLMNNESNGLPKVTSNYDGTSDTGSISLFDRLKAKTGDFPISITSSQSSQDEYSQKSLKSLSSVGSASCDGSTPACDFVLRPGQFDIILCVDNAEFYGASKGSSKTLLPDLIKNGVECELRKLHVGDLLWIAKEKTRPVPGQLYLPQGHELVLHYIIERKRMDDLVGSCIDGRYKEQKFRLKKCGLKYCIYLIEDYGSMQHFSLPEATIKQTITNTQVIDGFQVKRTKDPKETVAFLTVFTRYLQGIFKDKTLYACGLDELKECSIVPSISDREQRLPVFEDFNKGSVKTKALTVHEMFGKQLIQLHGMSAEKARAVITAYPTLSHLFKAYSRCSTEKEKETLLASIKCGKSVRNLGQAQSKQIYQLYNTATALS